MGEAGGESGAEQEGLEGQVRYESVGCLMGMRSLVYVGWWRGTMSLGPSLTL